MTEKTTLTLQDILDFNNAMKSVNINKKKRKETVDNLINIFIKK